MRRVMLGVIGGTGLGEVDGLASRAVDRSQPGPLARVASKPPLAAGPLALARALSRHRPDGSGGDDRCHHRRNL